MIDRQRVKRVFADYVAAYDMSNGKNALKVVHTYRVAEISDEIAVSLGMDSADCDLAWLIGMLHDIARFEQNRRYGSFNDLKTEDHAGLGVKILFEDGKMRDFVDSCEYDYVVEKAIRLHNKYRIDKTLDDRTKIFCNIIRDADKLDIFRVNTESSKEDVYEVGEAEFKNSEFSEGVFESFFKEKTVFKQLKKNPVDGLACHLSLVFELVYPISVSIAEKQGYVEMMMNYKSENPKALAQLEKMSEFLRAYIEKRKKEQNILELI